MRRIEPIHSVHGAAVELVDEIELTRVGWQGADPDGLFKPLSQQIAGGAEAVFELGAHPGAVPAAA